MATKRGDIILTIDDDLCQVCDDCLARQVCRANAIRVIDKGEAPVLISNYCWGCMACMKACACDAIVKHDSGSRA